MLKYLFLSALTLAVGCSSSDKFDKSTPEGNYAYAEKLLKQYRYEEAIQQFQLVRNQFPYSNLATESELRIGDIHFERESYIEAQSSYQLFKDLHPRHPRIAYVTFRLGMSYFNELPSSIDRDLTLADKAILYFDEVIRSYPESDYAAEAKEKRTKAYVMLAEKELYIARFYYKQEKFDSALGRFEDLLRKYPNAGLNAVALKGALLSSYKLEDRTKAKKFMDELQEKHKGSKELSEAQSEVGDELR